jgi:hypothetical protein
MTIEFSSYMAAFFMYFLLFNSNYCITQYFMIPLYCITYCIVAFMIFKMGGVRYGIYIALLCVVAFFFWGFLNYELYN